VGSVTDPTILANTIREADEFLDSQWCLPTVDEVAGILTDAWRKSERLRLIDLARELLSRVVSVEAERDEALAALKDEMQWCGPESMKKLDRLEAENTRLREALSLPHMHRYRPLPGYATPIPGRHCEPGCEACAALSARVPAEQEVPGYLATRDDHGNGCRYNLQRGGWWRCECGTGTTPGAQVPAEQEEKAAAPSVFGPLPGVPDGAVEPGDYVYRKGSPL
jgi:hypothetical protein